MGLQRGNAASPWRPALAADQQLLRHRLRTLLARPEVREAIFLASPSLEEALPHWLQYPESERAPLWACLLLGFIAGGLAVARWGLSRRPLRTLLWANLGMWTACVIFSLQPSIVLLSLGILIYLCLTPVAEAAEQTLLQKVIPLHRQGRVLGFAHSIELAASPLTAFLMGPLAQLVFIPFMTTGAGVAWLGGWFGSGPDRGMALLFIVAGLLGMLATWLAMQSHAYKSLAASDQEPENSQALPMAA